MAIGIIVGIILLIVAGALFWGAVVCYENNYNKCRVLCVVLAILCCLSFIIVPFSFHTVNSGELAVVKNLGKIIGTRDAGTNFDLWFTTSYHKYDTKVQNVEITTAAYSSDAQTMDVAMTLQYRVIPDKITDIATQYGTLEVLQGRIQSIVIEKTKAVLSSHKAMNIIANRASISPEVEAAVKAAVDEDYFVSVEAVVLTNIDFSDSFEKAVEDKMVAEQAKLKADYDNETKLAKAEADAKALKIAAEAEAEANKLLTQSLTEQVLESKFYEKWDGKLPQVMGEGSAILDIRDDE
jgi:regulator of protease activity HflC (stomatin/prohibitin superfamily)